MTRRVLLVLLAMFIIVVPATAQTFDNDGGGSWEEYMSFPITTSPTEYAQYKIVINGTTWELYNVTGSLEASGTNNKFWSLVNSSGADIRVFNQSGQQLYFWIEYFNATEQKAIIWVNLTAGSSELDVAYGNPYALLSNYNNFSRTFELFRYDPFDTIDTSFWTHRESTVQASSDTYVSPSTSLKLYYGTGSPYHADCAGSLPSRTFWIMEYWWRNSGSDSSTASDPDRGGGRLLTGGAHGTSVIGVAVLLDKIKYGDNVEESGSFQNVWLHFRLIYDNGEHFIYREENGKWILKKHIVKDPAQIDTVKFGIAGYSHAEYADDLYLYTVKPTDPTNFGTPIVKLFQKQFGTKTVYVNVTYLDTSVTERYNPTAYYKLEDKPQINVTSMLSVSGVNATDGANISIELIDFVTLDKVVYNGTDVTANLTYQGTITNSTTGYTYNVYNFTTYENGTLEIYGHVGNKAYEATFKLDGETVDVFNVTVVVGEALEITLPHRGNVTLASTVYTEVTSVLINTKDVGVGAKTLSITIDDPENFTVGYVHRTVNIDWGKIYFNVTDLQNKTLARTTYGFFNKNFSIISTDPTKLYAGDIEIDVYFHGVKLKSLEIYLNHTNNGLTLNVSVNATQFKDYRNVTRIIASPNYFEVVNLSTKYPFSVMKLVNVSGTVVVDFVSNAPTSVEVTGDVTSYSYEKPVLKLVASGNVTVADLYKVTEPLKDRLGNPVNFHVSFDGVTVSASDGIAAKLLKPDMYTVTVPTDVLGFKYHRLISSANLVPVPSGREAEGVYVKYTTSTPPSGWNTELLFNDSGWSTGRTPICDKTTCPTYVDLNGEHLYVRYAFNLSKIIRNHYPALNLSEWNITIEKATVYCEVDDECWVWLNGEQVLYAKLSANKWDGQADVTKYLDLDENLLAIHVYDSGGGANYLDFKLEAIVKLTRLNNSFTVNVSKDLNLPLAEYRVPTRFETNEVKIERFKLPFPLPFLPFSEPQEDEKVYVLVRLEGTLKDYYGAPVPNKEVRIVISSPNVTRIFNTTTDGSGNFFIETDFAKGIEYTVRYEFVGDDVYVESSTTKTFYPGELPVAPTPPAPAELTLIAIVVAVVAAMIVAAVFVVRRTRATARTRIESEFRFFRRIR